MRQTSAAEHSRMVGAGLAGARRLKPTSYGSDQEGLSMTCRIVFFMTCLFLTPAFAFTQDAAALYQRHCATCHEASAQTRAPTRDALRQLTPERILDALEAITGVMSAQGLARTPAERRALALWLSGKPFGTEKPLDLDRFACKEQTGFTEPLSRPNWNGWS